MIVIKIMKKRSAALSQGFCASAASPFTKMRSMTTSGSAVLCTAPNIALCSGEGQTGRSASPTARSRVGPNCMSPRFEPRAATHPVLWDAPWHSKEPECVRLGQS
ncbi:hypothetical protein TcCL_NonESM09405 [Trypanosoma cruzi]|nr:hypothetical protein TcCL_NonESM09405 [Trypanosoma cruzi]